MHNFAPQQFTQDRLALIIRAQYLSEQLAYMATTWSELNLLLIENGTDKAINYGITRLRSRLQAVNKRLKELEGMRK